jgi:L-ascorbate metabolism protein UlaG (beta-lactamase superfamily)
MAEDHLDKPAMKLSRRRLLTAVPAAGLVLGGVAYVRASQAAYYDGKVSDHFDGLRFFDPTFTSKRGPFDFWRWQTTRERAEWPLEAPSPFADKPPRRVDGKNLRVSLVGHASFLIQAGGHNILLDPVWSERASPFAFIGPRRVNVPGIAFDALPPIDTVLVSHGHYDHLDAATLAALATPHKPRVITPLGNDSAILDADSSIGVETHDWGSEIVLSPSVKVTVAPMRHWSARGLTDRNKALWASFVIETPAGRVYHVGDSGYGDGFYFRSAREQYGPFKLALLPIGAYEPRWFMHENHMNPEEAVKAFQDSGAEYALAHHFGTFHMADEAIDAPPQALDAALKAANIPASRFGRLKPGQVWEV